MIQKRSFKEDTEVNDVTKLGKAFQSEITFIIILQYVGGINDREFKGSYCILPSCLSACNLLKQM